MSKELEVIKSVPCSFNIFHEGRTYTGQHRQYVLENAKRIACSPATQEKIKLREAFGYYGHGRRILARKMELGEVETVKLADGTKVVITNVPSNVTTQFSVDDDGTVNHTQDFLLTDSGKIAAALHASRVGGFSWACPGSDGGSRGPSRMTGFSGFDYVMKPGFSANRGYILESADNIGQGVDRGVLLESIAKSTELDDKIVEDLFNGWSAQAIFYAEDLEARLEESELYESALVVKLEEREKDYLDLEETNAKLIVTNEQILGDVEKEKNHRKDLVNFICGSLPFFVPEEIKHAMMENDFDNARGIFESATQVDFFQLPLRKKREAERKVKITKPVKENYREVGWNV